MPISKIPIIHKFGIISHSQRLELQERLLKQSYLQTVNSQKVIIKSSKNPLEVTEEFIGNYNNAQNLDDREKYEAMAHKMLERSKRRAGLRNNGTGPYVNLPMAWTELAQLAQCKGKIQEDCLDVLITSLDQSPLERYHIPALFFLAETMLYSLRTDAVHQPYLRTGEIKLLKMGQLAFTRLFYHHMAGQLQGQFDFKNRLFTYLDGLGDCQEAYSPYPNALLSLRFIISVGKIIMADAHMEPGEIKEGDNVSISKPRTPLSRPSAGTQYSRTTRTTQESSANKDTREASFSAHSAGAISSSVHDLSPTLWHALDVWRCTNHLGGGLAEALRALATCGMGLANENWIDTMVALQILSEAAKTNLAAMKILHSLARGIRPKVEGGSEPATSRSGATAVVGHIDNKKDDVYSVSSDEETTKGEESRVSLPSSSKPTLSDIYERSEEDKDSEKKYSRHSKNADEADNENGDVKTFPMRRTKPVTLSKENLERFESKLKSSIKESPNVGLKGPGPREVSFGDSKLQTENSNLTKESVDRTKATRDSKRTTSYMTDPLPNTAWKAEAGSDLPEGRASEASSVPTYTNFPIPDTPGINGWHWEVAITYTDILADICLYGTNASVQKMALMGMNREVSEPFQRGYISVPLVSAGLLDLAFFQATSETKDGGPNDWSWRIRFGSIQSLVKICRCLASDINREGMKTAAWNVLLRAHSMEKDDRVLEALKVGQVHTDLESLLSKVIVSNPQTIGSKIAGGLSHIYLPPLPPPVDPYMPPARKEQLSARSKGLVNGTPRSPLKNKPVRTSLKEEIQIATALYEPPVDFNKRTSFDLRRIVEDQWRKELQKDLEEEEKERQSKLLQKQKEEEERQREIADLKAGKYKKKQTNKENEVPAADVGDKEDGEDAVVIDKVDVINSELTEITERSDQGAVPVSS